MARKLQFYAQYGVEEDYLYDPDRGRLSGWRREGPLADGDPEDRRLGQSAAGVRFDLSGEVLALFGPDGRRFATTWNWREQNEALAEQNEVLALRAERLAARLRELGVDPEA